MLHFIQNLKLIRVIANKTQLQFAELFDVKGKNGRISKDIYYTYESGKTPPPDYFISDVAKYAGVSEDDLKNKILSRAELKIEPKSQNGQIASGQTDNRLIETKDELIASLKRENRFMQEKYETLEKKYDNLNNKIEMIETNLKSALNNQKRHGKLLIHGLVAMKALLNGRQSDKKEFLDNVDKLFVSQTEDHQ